MARIYMVLSGIACEDAAVDAHDYAAFVRAELHRLYPDAQVEIAVSDHEVGDMPCVVEADTWEGEAEMQEAMGLLWDRYCTYLG